MVSIFGSYFITKWRLIFCKEIPILDSYLFDDSIVFESLSFNCFYLFILLYPPTLLNPQIPYEIDFRYVYKKFTYSVFYLI